MLCTYFFRAHYAFTTYKSSFKYLCIFHTCLSVRAYKYWWSWLKRRSLRMGFPLLTTTFSYCSAGWIMVFTRIWGEGELLLHSSWLMYAVGDNNSKSLQSLSTKQITFCNRNGRYSDKPSNMSQMLFSFHCDKMMLVYRLPPGYQHFEPHLMLEFILHIQNTLWLQCLLAH